MTPPAELPVASEVLQPVTVLVVTSPGRVRDSLLTLLHSLPGIQTVFQAETAAAAQTTLARAAPRLLLLDWDLWDEKAEALLRAARAKTPRPYCVSVVGGESQQTAAWQADSDAVLIKGFSLGDLWTIVQRCAAASGRLA